MIEAKSWMRVGVHARVAVEFSCDALDTHVARHADGVFEEDLGSQRFFQGATAGRAVFDVERDGYTHCVVWLIPQVQDGLGLLVPQDGTNGTADRRQWIDLGA